MSSDATAPAIRAEALSKCYHLYDRPADRLRQLLARRRRYYREFWALRDASFTVARGEALGVIGRNGAGKSTLLQLVCGTLAPTSGELAVNGRVAALLELGAGFNPEFTGRENVRMAAAILGLSAQETAARFDGIVDFSGIREFIDQPVKIYSSGMYVRLAFAVATSVDPEILVIDEALSVGDGEFARKSFDRIMALKRAGVTILFCSHSLYQVEAFCDRVLWLEHGRPGTLGAAQEVVRRYTRFLAEGEAAAGELPPLPSPATPAPDHTATSLVGYAKLARIAAALDGKPGTRLLARPGESTLTVMVQFDSDPALPPPVVGVTLDYGTQLVATCAISRSDNIAIERDARGRGEATVTFPRLALRNGEYRISVYLGCENALHIYDSAPGCATLDIEDDRPDPGLVSLPHSWRISPGHAAHDQAEPASGPRGWRRAHLADGRSLWVDAADTLGLAVRGVYEPAESQLCESLLRPGNRVLDIGANLGYYTTLCAERVGATGHVDAIEPDPESFALLDANTRELQEQGRVRLHALALAERSGNARLFRGKNNTGMHRLYESVCCDGIGTEVAVRRGDELALAPLDLIKVDVEGFEPYVLKGLTETLARSPRAKILCEFSPLAMLEAGANPRCWLAWIEAQGFSIRSFDGSTWSEAACADLRQQAERLARVDVAALRARLQGADHATIAVEAAAAASAQGYTRPIVENVLLVRAGTQ